MQTLDWVDQASVLRRFPNQLHVTIVEREPFVVWQHKGQTLVVDRKGKTMSGLRPEGVNVLLHVSGAGANTTALELVNQLEVVPDLRSDIRAAARVGERRWTLYLRSGLKIALPEVDVELALQTADRAIRSPEVAGGSVSMLDLRVRGEISYQILAAQVDSDFGRAAQ